MIIELGTPLCSLARPTTPSALALGGSGDDALQQPCLPRPELGDGLGRAVRSSLFKYRLHQDADLFNKAYGYIRQYY